MPMLVRRQPKPATITIQIGNQQFDPKLDAARRRLRLLNPNTPIKVTISDGTYTATCDNITPLLVAKTEHTGFNAGYHLAWLQKKVEHAVLGLEELTTEMLRDTTGGLNNQRQPPTETNTNLSLGHNQIRDALPNLIPWLLDLPKHV